MHLCWWCMDKNKIQNDELDSMSMYPSWGGSSQVTCVVWYRLNRGFKNVPFLAGVSVVLWLSQNCIYFCSKTMLPWSSIVGILYIMVLCSFSDIKDQNTFAHDLITDHDMRILTFSISSIVSLLVRGHQCIIQGQSASPLLCLSSGVFCLS